MNLLNEHKFWGKSNLDIIEWLKDKSNRYWVLLDTETTGLPNKSYNVQLTQISGIVVKWDVVKNEYVEVDEFNKKIKLSDETKSKINEPNRIKWVLSFNRYGEKMRKYELEEEVLKDFKDFIDEYDNPILVAQNAEFDMKMLNTRSNLKFENEVICTKQLLQLFYLPTLQKLAESDLKYKNTIDGIGISDRDNGLISSSMGKIGPIMNINMEGYHDALTDCRLMAQMLQKTIDFLKENIDLDIKKYQMERIKTKR
jgi:DNA polymerase III alpha subunit (gram-positive type)